MNLKTFLANPGIGDFSDLFISAGKAPASRSLGEMVLAGGEAVAAEDIISFRRELIGERGEEQYRNFGSFDCSFPAVTGERYRLNFFETINGPSLVARIIANGDKLEFARLGLPEREMSAIADLKRGIVIVAGPTGSGKSTTMGAIINSINHRFRRHILTLEDPIEFIHNDDRSLISQREINTFVSGFEPAIRNAMRENPDVIVIGEMRDRETFIAAVTAALTGHLVITSMHTNSAVQSVERILNYFPPAQQRSVASDLAQVLEAVVVQQLLPNAAGTSMLPVLEILLGTPLVRKMIAEGDYLALEDAIRRNRAAGMTTFNQSLYELLEMEKITLETAKSASPNISELNLLREGIHNDNVQNPLLRVDADSELNLKQLLRAAVFNGASDILLTADSPPMLRINGAYCALDMAELTSQDVRQLLYSVIDKRRIVILEEQKELDFALSMALPVSEGAAEEERRFRGNAFFQRGSLAMVARVIPNRIPSPEELLLPPILLSLIQKKQGLILVTGPTGSGKSTTLASLIQRVNETSPLHIITIEDPIEYSYHNNCAVIEQRELGFDTMSFEAGLRAAMREAPDIILVGEMRDTATIGAALTAAETGHLVLGTLHTNSAVQTVDRIVDSFPEGQQNQIRQQFAASLLGVVSQRLMTRRDTSGRIGAFEVLVATPPIQALIRESKTHMIQSAMETGAKDGMITLDWSLKQLYMRNIISFDDLSMFKVEAEY